MKIFEKRPLALILCIMLGGFSFFADFDQGFKLICASVPLVLIGIIFIFDNLKCGRKRIIVLSLAALSVSVVLSFLWSSLFFPTKYYDETVSVKAKIYEIDNSNSNTSVITLKTEEINGSKDRHTFISFVDKETAVRLRRYDVVTLNARLTELSSYDDGFDGKSYYISKGYSANLSDITDLEILDNDVDKFNVFFKDLQRKISNKLKLRTNFETGAFLSALIVGERSDLSGSTRLNFSRLGISHILALSGMHLAILSLAVNSLLIRFGVKKKIRSIVMILLVLFYMALTGFMASVLRSGLMLIISYLLYLLAKKSDPVTSLVIAVSLIVLCDPTSVFDLSLWLSAFATLGVVIFAEIATKADKDATVFQKTLLAFKNACLVSVFAFCATFSLVALRFEYFSVASILTTLIFSFVIQFFIYAGILLLLIGGFIPFGRIVIAFSNAILWLAERISSIKFIHVSMNSIVIKIMILTLSVFFFAFLILEIKNKKKGIAVIVSLMLSVFLIAELHTINQTYDDDIIYAPSTSGDVILLKSEGDITAIYSGNAFLDNTWDILEILAQENIVYVDNLVLTSYSYSTTDFSQELMNGIKVEKIYLPTPITKDEKGQVEGLNYLIDEYGIELELYDLIENINFGKYSYRLFDKVDYAYGEHPANVFQIRSSDKSFTYVSVCEYDKLSASAKALLFNSENLLIGTVGNSNYYLFDMRLPDIGRIYFYDTGRITDEAGEYYKNKGALAYLTKTPVSLLD